MLLPHVGAGCYCRRWGQGQRAGLLGWEQGTGTASAAGGGRGKGRGCHCRRYERVIVDTSPN